MSGLLGARGRLRSRFAADSRRERRFDLPHQWPEDLDLLRGPRRYLFPAGAHFAGKGGISIFLLPMDTPGIIVRQIASIIGEGDIHEVFFDNVEVPDSALLGAEGQAWEIARTALSLERVGIPRFALANRMLGRAVDKLKSVGRFGHGAVEQAASARAACEAARFYSYSIVDRRRHGKAGGPEASAARYATVMAERLVADFVVEHVPESLSGGDPMLLAHHQRAIVAGIASGAAEIQLNLIATELLGLPREPR